MELLSEAAVLILMVCGILMMISSIFGGRIGGRMFRFFGGVILFVLCIPIFAGPLMSMISRIVDVVVTWVLRIGTVALVIGLLYLLVNFFRRH